MTFFTSIAVAIVGAGSFLVPIVAGALQVAAGIALSYVAKAIAGQPEGPRFEVKGQVQGGDDVPRSILFGFNATAGSIVYANTWGQANGVGNAYLVQVIALADYPIRELLSIEVNGIPDTLGPTALGDRGFPVLGFRKNGVDHMWVKFYDGTQTTADTYLTGTVASAARPYDSNRVGRGIPYAIVTCMAPERKDGEQQPLFTSGIPRFKFITNGARLYDPSRDTTVGGSGTQRYADPSTWGGDGDFLPAVQVYNILRGIRYAGGWLYGPQSLPAARLPAANWIEQINKCRAGIAGPAGTEPTYRTGGELDVSAQVKDAIEAFLTGCQGKLSEVGGVYKIHVGEPGSPVLAFTDGDILSTEEQTFTPFYGLEDTINGIQATYPNPAEGWSTKTAPPLIRTDLEALDGNRRLMASVALTFVPYTGQVQRIVQSALREAQRARRHTFVMGPEFWVLEPGDVVRWTSTRNGYEEKLFRVDGMADRGNLDVMLDLTEVDPSDYSWNQDTDFRPVIDGPLQLVGTPALPAIGWQVYGAIVLDQMGRARRPGIEVAYQPGLQGVREVRVQVRVPSATNPFIDSSVPYGDPWRTQIAGNFPPNTLYEVRGIYVLVDGGDAEWSAWLDVTTPDVKLTPGLDFDPFEGVIGFEQLGDDLGGFINWVGQSPRELIEAIQDTNTHAADQEMANSDTFRQVRTEVAVTVGDVAASFQQSITVAIVPIQNELQALADYLTELTAGNGSDVSTGRFRMTVLSGPTGYSRIGAETRVDTADPLAWRGAAWYLDTPNNSALPTRFLVNADQFIVVNGTDTASPFIVSGGAIRANNAIIRELEALNLKTRSITADRMVLGSLTSAEINVTQLVASSAFVDNLVVRTGNFEALSVGRNALADGAFADYIDNGGSSGSGGTVTYVSTDFIAGAKPVTVGVSAFVTRNGSPDGSVNAYLDNVSTGAQLVIGGSAVTGFLTIPVIRKLVDGQTYRLRLVVSNSGTQGSIGVSDVNFGGQIPRK